MSKAADSEGGAEKALRGVRDLVLSQFFTKAITFGFLIAFLRILSREELAVIPLYFAVGAASTLLFSFGIPATLVREVPRLRMTEPQKMHSLLFTATLIVSLGIIFSTGIAFVFQQELQNAFFSGLAEQVEFSFFFAAMLVGGWKTFLTFVLRSLQMYQQMAIFTGVSDLLIRLLGLVGLLIYGVNGLLAGFFLGSLLVNVYMTVKVYSFIFSTRQLYPIREIFEISWPFYFEGYINYFRTHGDVFLISAILGPPALAVYYVAKRIYELLVTVLSSVEYVIAPSLSQLLGKSVASVASGYDKLMLLIPLLIVPICVVGAGLGYWFVDVLAGDEYTSEAYLTSGAFCIVGLLKTLTTIRVATVFVVCPSTSRLKITLGQFVVYFGLLYLLVSHIGILGAAIAQGCSFIFGFLYAARMLSPILGKRKISRLVRIVFLTSVIGLLAIIGLQLWYYSIFVVPVYVLAVAGIVILAISLLAKDSDLQELEGILPNQLKNVFGIYFRARNRLFGKS